MTDSQGDKYHKYNLSHQGTVEESLYSTDKSGTYFNLPAAIPIPLMISQFYVSEQTPTTVVCS